MIGSLENERVTLEREVEKLRTFEREYRSRLKSYLESQLRELDGRADPGARGGGTGRRAGSGGSPAQQGQPGTGAAQSRSRRVHRWAATAAEPASTAGGAERSTRRPASLRTCRRRTPVSRWRPPAIAGLRPRGGP